MPEDIAITELDRENMRAAMDRLIPATDDLSGAGEMGLLDAVEDLAARHDRYGEALVQFLKELSDSAGNGSRFTTQESSSQDEALRSLEETEPKLFATILEILFLAYYADPAVQARIGWPGGTLQPTGFSLPPFDEKILKTVRRRESIWRKP